MFNADIPTRAELPTSKQLVRSTLIALGTAVVLLVTTVLPGEYGIDPTGVGRVLGLTQMGEIKLQLAQEAEADRAGALVQAETPQIAAPMQQEASAAGRRDEMSVTLAPGEGAEVKLRMNAGARAEFTWNSTGNVNYDLHGDGGGRSISYEQGRGVPSHTGAFEAAFDGSHGWFWRNRGTENVTITLNTNGEYAEIRRVL